MPWNTSRPPARPTPCASAHAHYILAQVEAAESQLTGVERGVWLARLEREHDNLRAALAWSQDAAPTDDRTGLLLRWALSWFWYFRGYLSEGRAWAEGMLARDDMRVHADDWARVLGSAGVLAYLQSDYAARPCPAGGQRRPLAHRQRRRFAPARLCPGLSRPGARPAGRPGSVRHQRRGRGPLPRHHRHLGPGPGPRPAWRSGPADRERPGMRRAA